MTLAAMTFYLPLALATPLQLLTPTPFTLASPLPPPNLPTTLSTYNTTALTARAHCFLKPSYPGAPTLHDTNYNDCHDAVTALLLGKDVTALYTFGRSPDAKVRLPCAATFRTCKIIVDLMDETWTELLRWRDISDALEAPKGVLRNCLGQGGQPPWGGRTSVGLSGAMQVIVLGQVWRAIGVV